MRRLAARRRSVERCVLTSYRFISGYGLTARRALLALLAILSTTILLTTAFGVADTAANQPAAKSFTIGSRGLVIFDLPPQTKPTTVNSDRWTLRRLEIASRNTLSATVFRGNAEELNNAGKWIQMFTKFAGAFLLALSLLAIRARVKR